jgi:adenosine/AMP kinase
MSNGYRIIDQDEASAGVPAPARELSVPRIHPRSPAVSIIIKQESQSRNDLFSARSRSEIEEPDMQLVTVRIEKPEAINFVLGQTHFIKSVEDIHEALVGAVPGIKFGLAFCEASGKCLVRWSGTDDSMVELGRKNAVAIAAGHSFILFLGEGFYPLNVLNTLKMVPEVCRIFCATANPTEVVVAATEQGRGILGVVDGFSPKGVETDDDINWRKGLLRQIGYKL